MVHMQYGYRVWMKVELHIKVLIQVVCTSIIHPRGIPLKVISPRTHESMNLGILRVPWVVCQQVACILGKDDPSKYSLARAWLSIGRN